MFHTKNTLPTQAAAEQIAMMGYAPASLDQCLKVSTWEPKFFFTAVGVTLGRACLRTDRKSVADMIVGFIVWLLLFIFVEFIF